jgi:asparagine synthase (glutamine-hydrolysing)
MCGIVGVAWRNSAPGGAAAERFRAALSALRHRGPDASGEEHDAAVWLGHNRLSILDLSPDANQPMRSADGRFVIAYNGEVYNYRDLATEHGLRSLRTASDTEVVLRLFAERGVQCLRTLNGMFAFAIHDRARQTLWLVRDRFGIKPLYFAVQPDRLAFASEIKAILALDGGAPRCDTGSLHEWLYFGNTLGSRTMYCGIEQLLPGQYLELDLVTFSHEVRPYWALESRLTEPRAPLPASRSTVEQTRALLESAVRRQLVSDVPIGVFLSGGVDSSAITAFAARHYHGRIATYSVGFDFEPDGGELPKARRVAQHFDTEHHEVRVTGEMAGELIEKMIACHDSPFSDAANIPLYLMASHLSGQVKVILQGDGGDELFGGYRRYSTVSRYRMLHQLARGLRPLVPLLSNSDLHCRIRRHVIAFAAPECLETIALLLSPEDRTRSPSAVFAPQMRRAVERADPFARHRQCWALFDALEPIDGLSMIDLKITLPDLYLEKVDRSTMAASLEVRVPFLDHELADFVAALPARVRLQGGRPKWLLKAALAGVVPDEVLSAPKVGLNVPFGKWLHGKLKGFFLDHLAYFESRNSDILDAAHVRMLFAQSAAGRGNQSNLLWKVLNFVVWANLSKVEFGSGSVS